MSVWRSLEDLRAYVYRSAHAEVLRRRAESFTRMETVYAALWWAKKRLAHLDQHGPTPFAVTFKAAFPPDEAGAPGHGPVVVPAVSGREPPPVGAPPARPMAPGAGGAHNESAP